MRKKKMLVAASTAFLAKSRLEHFIVSSFVFFKSFSIKKSVVPCAIVDIKRH